MAQVARLEQELVDAKAAWQKRLEQLEAQLADSERAAKELAEQLAAGEVRWLDSGPMSPRTPPTWSHASAA